jgi:hypothetical protein
MKSGRPEHVESLLKRIDPLWNQAARLPAGPLLRLALTRELARSLHTLHSELLATGDDCEAREVIEREKYLSARFEELGLENDALALRQVYARSSKGNSGNNAALHVQPPAHSSIGLKLNRPDRAWESAMAIAAEKLGWQTWTLECWIHVTEVEEWGRLFSERLWPRGLILFVESTAFEASRWRGKWYLLLDPELRSPEGQGFEQGSGQPLWSRATS